jgi:hypothetical protein
MFSQFDTYFQLAEKLCFIVGAIIYMVFASIVVKQVSMGTKNIQDKFNDLLIIFSWIHFILSIFLVILTLFL